MSRWVPAAILLAVCGAAALIVPGWLRGRRVQADFDELLRAHPDLKVESFRPLTPSELDKLERRGGVRLVLAASHDRLEPLVTFGAALQHHQPLNRSFPTLTSYTSSISRLSLGQYEHTDSKLIVTLATDDPWITLRNGDNP